MNTNDVERRLEALAAASANPDLPPAILDKLARLEAGSVVMTPLQVQRVPAERRASKRSVRGLMLLGLAATLTLTGGLIYAVATQNKPNSSPTPPVTLGQWQQMHTFSGSPYDQFETVWLSWQNDEIVGVANGHDKFDLFQSCVLQSKDGTDWTCANLPKPADICSTDSCATNLEVAVSNGAWVATGLVQNQGASGTALPPATSVTWTSSDGTTWTEQPGQRLPNYTGAAVLYIYSAPPTELLATRHGFVRGGTAIGTLAAGANVLMTSTDGVTWQPARLSAGSLAMSSATLAAGPDGYLAVGTCAATTGSSNQPCAAHSPDGETWTTSSPAAGATSGLADRLQASGNPAFFDGKWVVSMVTHMDISGTGTMPSDSGYYEALSADGLNWTIQQRSYPTRLENAFSDYGTYYAVVSQQGTSGLWAISGAESSGTAEPTIPYLPPDAPHTYWSEEGTYWQRITAGPEGYPLAIVETPTQVLAFIAAYPAGSGPDSYPNVIPTVSVWAADKH
jgi:hypothetical protein